MGKLTNMQVERVDGVDKPAIRKRWVLVKNEDAEQTEVEKDYAGAARAAVEAIAKEGVSFSDETVEVLRALVELLDLDIEFAAKAEADADAEADAEANADADADADATVKDENADADADANADGEAKTYTADEVEDLVAKALRAAGVDPEKVAKSYADVEPLRVAKSKQPKAQDALEGASRTQVKKGEGMFSNVIFAKPDAPYSR